LLPACLPACLPTAVGVVSAVAVSLLLGAHQPALAIDTDITQTAVDEYSKLEASGKFSSKGAGPTKALEDFRQRYRCARARHRVCVHVYVCVCMCV